MKRNGQERLCFELWIRCLREKNLVKGGDLKDFCVSVIYLFIYFTFDAKEQALKGFAFNG